MQCYLLDKRYIAIINIKLSRGYWTEMPWAEQSGNEKDKEQSINEENDVGGYASNL